MSKLRFRNDETSYLLIDLQGLKQFCREINNHLIMFVPTFKSWFFFHLITNWVDLIEEKLEEFELFDLKRFFHSFNSYHWICGQMIEFLLKIWRWKRTWYIFDPFLLCSLASSRFMNRSRITIKESWSFFWSMVRQHKF